MANRCANPTAFSGSAPPWSLPSLDADQSAQTAALNDSSLGYVNAVATDTGLANAYVIALPFGSPTAYQNGMTVAFFPAHSNTAASTIAVSGLSAVPIKEPDGTPTVTGDINANVLLTLIYVSPNFYMVNAIGPGAVTGSQIAAATITSANLAANSVTSAAIAAATIVSADIAAATIAGSNIASATVTGTNIAAATVTGANVAAATITGANIAAATIAGSNIASGTIAAGNLAANAVTSAAILNATITGSDIAAATITGSNLVAATVTGTQIASATITSTNLAANSVTSAAIAAATIVSSDIAAGTIAGSNIASGTVTGTNIAANTIEAANLDVASVTNAAITVVALGLGPLTAPQTVDCAGAISVSVTFSVSTVGVNLILNNLMIGIPVFVRIDNTSSTTARNCSINANTPASVAYNVNGVSASAATNVGTNIAIPTSTTMLFVGNSTPGPTLNLAIT